MNFADMPTHVLNDVNAALWLAFLTGFVIVSQVLAFGRRRPRRWRARS